MLRRAAQNERVRVPAPVVRRRLPSGRGAVEQPNASGDGPAALTPIFWVAIVFTGVASGLLGDLLMALLFNIEHLAFGYHSGSLLDGVRQASHTRQVVSLLIAGAFGGVAWFVLRRFSRGTTEVDDALWRGTGELSFWRSLATAGISEVVIGMGASIGREAGPKLMGGAAMQAPPAALVIVLELTDSGLGITVPMIAATVVATAITRYLDGYSIYSARLPALAPAAVQASPGPGRPRADSGGGYRQPHDHGACCPAGKAGSGSGLRGSLCGSEDDHPQLAGMREPHALALPRAPERVPAPGAVDAAGRSHGGLPPVLGLPGMARAAASLLRPVPGRRALPGGAVRMIPAGYGLEGQVIIVTGASRGIGLGCARFLADQGAKLILTGRKPTGWLPRSPRSAARRPT